jgi:hypothetical protein
MEIKLLVKKGTDINAIKRNKKTSLQLAVKKDNEETNK